MSQSQCEASNGLCSWDSSQDQGPTDFDSTGCKYIPDLEWGYRKEPEDVEACLLLTTKETCTAAGGSVGRDGCSWWDVDICEPDTAGLYVHTWGCQSETSCALAGGKWCGSCTRDEISYVWKDHYQDQIMQHATGNRGRCLKDCGQARKAGPKYAGDDPTICDKVSLCGYVYYSGGDCRDDAKGIVAVGFPLFLGILLQL